MPSFSPPAKSRTFAPGVAAIPSSALQFGFRDGPVGTHSSRTMMLTELRLLLAAVPPTAPAEVYAHAIVDDNVLAKRTSATRSQSAQRLHELYSLDPQVSLFRALRQLWDMDPDGQPLLALLLALARDPLLRATADPALATPIGAEWSRAASREALEKATGSRLKTAVIDKVIRNAAATWTQSGHYAGRVRKVRRRVQATPGATAYAGFLGFLLGLRGKRLLESSWMRVLDGTPSELSELLQAGKKLGLVDFKHAGDVIDVTFPNLLSLDEAEAARGAD